MTERSTAALEKPTALQLNPANSGLLQRKCACGNHTVADGKCAECAKKKTGLQRKLTIGSSNDPLELEADWVANQVIAAPAHSKASSAPPRIQHFRGQASDGAASAPPSVDRVLSGSGKPLEPALQHDMGQRFGHDLSKVRVHSDGAAAQSAREVNANAYTVGNNIVFGRGQFEPATSVGRRLLAHELAHVVQQRGPSAASAIQRAPAKIVMSGQHLEIDLTSSSWRQTLEFEGGQTQVVYVLRDATTGEYLKVGKTTVTAIAGRLGEYVTAGNKWSRKLVADVWTFRARSTKNVEAFEAEIRAGLEKAGARLPWDNTKARLGRAGQGIPMPKEQTETEFIEEAEQLRVKHAPPNIPPRRGMSSKQKAKLKNTAAETQTEKVSTKVEQGTEKATTEPASGSGTKGEPSSSRVPTVTKGTLVKGVAKNVGISLALSLLTNYLGKLNARMETEKLENDLTKAKKSFIGNAKRLKAQHPDKPVYLTLTVRHGDFDQQAGYLGWGHVTELGIWHAGPVVNEAIDPPQVKIEHFDPFTALLSDKGLWEAYKAAYKVGTVTYITYTDPYELEE